MSEEPGLVGRRVDALVCAFRAVLNVELVSALMRLRGQAQEAHHHIDAPFFGPAKLAVAPGGPVGAVVLVNGDCSVLVHPEGAAGWTLEVRLFAAYLATISPSDAILACRSIGRMFGAWGEQDERCRRLDLCADFTAFPLNDGDDNSFVTRQRARKTRFKPSREELAELPPSRRYSVGDIVTGIAVCMGSPLMARIYDKTAELEHIASEGRREREQTIWKASGWDGESPVSRVEFQIRGDVLFEFGVRDALDEIPNALDGIWQYASGKWLSLRQKGEATRLCRAPLDVRWEAVTKVVWLDKTPPMERVRRRGGASVEQALGCVVSHLGALGVLESLQDEKSLGPIEASLLTEGQAGIGLRTELVSVLLAFAGAVERNLVQKFKHPRLAFAAWRLRVMGTISRFAVFHSLARAGP